jgi:hypothetical protein
VVMLVPVTTEAGEWLERRTPATDLLREHAQVGDTALWVALPVAVLASVIWWRASDIPVGARLRDRLAPGSRAVTTVLAVLAVAVAGIAMYDIYRIGDSGSKAAWHDRVTSAARPHDRAGRGSAGVMILD